MALLPNRSRLKAAYFTGLRLLRRDQALLKGLAGRPALVIANLHRVSPHPSPFWPPLHPFVFEELLRFLVRSFHLTSFRDYSTAPTTKPAAILSFDDGYGDFVDYATPLLEKYRVSANQNVIPACVESGSPPWNVQLYDFLDEAPASLIREISLPGFSASVGDGSDAAKARFGIALSAFLKMRSRSEREAMLGEMAPVLERNPPDGGTRMMNRTEVRQAARDHEIGAHSFSHDSMGFESDEFFERDTDECVAYFAQTLELPLWTYAFPNGSYKGSQLDPLRRRGIRHILLTGEKIAAQHPADGVYPRLTITAETPAEARFQALGYRRPRIGALPQP